MATEVVFWTLDDMDFGVIEHIETRTRAALDGGPLRDLVYRSWRGRCEAVDAEILVSSEECPPNIDDGVRLAYRTVLAEVGAFKTDVARRTIELARDWVAADGLEIDFDEAQFARELRIEGFSVDQDRLTVWVKNDWDVFDGHSLEVRIEDGAIAEICLAG